MSAVPERPPSALSDKRRLDECDAGHPVFTGDCEACERRVIAHFDAAQSGMALLATDWTRHNLASLVKGAAVSYKFAGGEAQIEARPGSEYPLEVCFINSAAYPDEMVTATFDREQAIAFAEAIRTASPAQFDPADIPVADGYSREDFGTDDEVRGWNLCREYVIAMLRGEEHLLNGGSTPNPTEATGSNAPSDASS